MDTEKIIEGARELLTRADSTTHTLFDASKSLGALILACGKLLEVVEEQQSRIEQLEDVLQNHLENTPRRRL